MVSDIDSFLLDDVEMSYLTTTRKQENGISVSVSRILHLFKEAFPDCFVKSGLSSYTKSREVFAPLQNMKALLAMRLSPYLASQSTSDELHKSISPVGMPKSSYFKEKLRDIVFKYYMGNIFDFCVFKRNNLSFEFVPFDELFDVFLTYISNSVSDVDAISFVEYARIIQFSVLIATQNTSFSIKVLSGCRYLFTILHHIPKRNISIDSFKEKFTLSFERYREAVRVERENVS